MTTQESHNETRHGLASENATLRNQLHTIGVEAARALDWTNEETWKKALQRIAALARAEEATKSTTPACKRTKARCQTIDEAEKKMSELINKTGKFHGIEEIA